MDSSHNGFRNNEWRTPSLWKWGRSVVIRCAQKALWFPMLLALNQVASISQAQNTVMLPIEVVSNTNKTRLVPFSVAPAALSGIKIKALTLRIHNISYNNKVSIQINNNAWI